MQIDRRDRYLGCLIGLAVGDALGAPGEFLSLSEIKRRFGDNGITDLFEWGKFPPGSYTDDTQLSLSTAIGCLRAQQEFRESGIFKPVDIVYHGYLDWLKTQNDAAQRRSPGNTCLTALRSGRKGTINEKINDSKGCGGVMRAAPVGLAFGPGDAFKRGAEFAAITHGHPSGYLPAGFLAEIIAGILEGKSPTEAIGKSTIELKKYGGYQETLEKVKQAVELVGKEESIPNTIKMIGEGWVGEEALGISLYCALKYSGNWVKGTLAAVNHSGDSDSTGSITGAILGTLLGVEAIPERWVQDVENSDRIQEIATNMYRAFRKGEKLSFDDYPPN
jgi:ADP-ribosylglycohydrolase